MDINNITAVYFVGAGGIGMSALIRYFLSKGKKVAGYDKTPSGLTEQLNYEGAVIHYEDNVDLIPDDFTDPAKTLVVYTPAVPEAHSELCYFRGNGFEVMKRARVLGEITNCNRGLCVAGTHGKTTTSSMVAHLLKQSHVDCNAFLGGILKNYDSNLMLSAKSDLTVIEADEFDRSFHWLRPYMAVITAADPDHLDIYGTPEAYRESFEHFTSLIRPDGCLIMKQGIDVTPRLQEGVTLYTYSATEGGDFHAENIRIGGGEIFFDFVGPDVRIPDIQLGVPVKVNIENGVAAIALAWLNGATPEEIKHGMATFAGPRRRFDFHLKKDNIVLIDDYAHHPAELKASILSVKELYAGRKVTGIFQPHLYTRTRDFAADFAASLSLLDELILLDIYPAREEPIPGVTSQIIFDAVTTPDKRLIRKEELLDVVSAEAGRLDVVLMVGAGNIELLVEPVKQILDKKE
ncbi:UDP-N-acetylmuramate--L-alanine ligase [uncultured Parabacteroides sp.]|uniref:UDP-N-acetylmuramate--L-alanine ligase n=1 Tax=uncultured Parabacteroides sp. TaxID=512312 RepID=UPI0025EE32FE|nr:UDP-N-acetylmuramate--L-alanine ligase [uncultured Parabacteroides sp.]